MVGVMVAGLGVAVYVMVGVNVTVGVGVAALNGELSPNNQNISAAAPTMRRIAAPIMTAIGVPCRICCRLRCASINFWVYSF
jgi:predicted transcriptional regulator